LDISKGSKNGWIRSWIDRGFFLSELSTLDLKDKRLNIRAKNIFTAMQKRVTTCVRRLFYDAKESRQAYDFYSNPKVTGSRLLEPHIQQTVARIKESNSSYILAIQDQTYLNYTSHRAKTGLGRISNVAGKHNQYGLIQHNVLCVSDKNEPLGLLDVQHFDFDDFASPINSDKRSLETKKTRYWVDALNKLQARLGTDAAKVITVADREGDFFEFLHALTEHKASYIVRCQHDRCTGEKYQTGEKLFERLEKTADIGEMTVEINDVKTRVIKSIQLKLKKLESVTVPAPRWASQNSKDKNYKPIQINVVMAYNEEYCWILLTNLDVTTFSDCQKIVFLYKERWHIEDYHKVLKTGYQVDEIYLHSSREAIENALIIASICACRLYWLIFVGRVEKDIKADSIFTELEWKSVYVYFKESIPLNVPPLAEIISRIAQLGGYKKQKNAKPPGIKTMWLGWQSFTVAAEMYTNIMSTKT
jgi:hypothetical protein